jgi:6,7-dimethyl-8-ribityllumazine synthase
VSTRREQKEALHLDGSRFRIAIVVSQFHDDITRKLEEGARACLARYGVLDKNVSVFRCPGSFELPQVANRLLQTKRWDAVVCLGAIIRGETAHFEYVAAETARGIQDVALKHARPVTFGVLTTENEQQALERAGGSHGNKGWDAALSAIEMLDVLQQVKKGSMRRQ